MNGTSDLLDLLDLPRGGGGLLIPSVFNSLRALGFQNLLVKHRILRPTIFSFRHHKNRIRRWPQIAWNSSGDSWPFFLNFALFCLCLLPAFLFGRLAGRCFFGMGAQNSVTAQALSWVCAAAWCSRCHGCSGFGGCVFVRSAAG